MGKCLHSTLLLGEREEERVIQMVKQGVLD